MVRHRQGRDRIPALGHEDFFHALLTPWLGSKFPKFFKNGYEPLFFGASLSFAEKIAQWRMQPVTSLQLVTTVLMLSLLAVGVASVG